MCKTKFHYRSQLTILVQLAQNKYFFFNLFTVYGQYAVQILTENHKKEIDDKTLKMPYKTMAKLNSLGPDTLKNAKKV